MDNPVPSDPPGPRPPAPPPPADGPDPRRPTLDDVEPSDEAKTALVRSTEALRRAVYIETSLAPRVTSRARELSMSNHFVRTIELALGVA